MPRSARPGTHTYNINADDGGPIAAALGAARLLLMTTCVRCSTSGKPLKT